MSTNGAIAQLGERLNGIQEVVGSIPIGSTKKPKKRDKRAAENCGSLYVNQLNLD